MKITGSMLVAIFAIAILAAVVFGVISIPGISQQNIVLTPPTQPTPTPSVQTSDLVSVTKQLKLVCVDELAGGNLDGTTNALTIYDSDGKTVLETLTLSSGSATTGNTYPSGKQLWIKYYYDGTTDSYMFWQVTVPQMSSADAESLTTNSITLKTREGGTYTDNLITSSGLTLTDGTMIDTSGTGNDTGTMTYSFYTVDDNTGIATFRDPIYNLDMKVVVWAELSGTGYSTFSLAGFDGGFEKGTTMYYYKVIDPNSVAKYKVANDYVYPGAGSVSFSWNCIGYSNSTSEYVTLQLYLKAYSNPSYMQQYGSYGPYAVQLAEQTIRFADI